MSAPPWVASDNGRVVKIVGVTDGLASQTYTWLGTVQMLKGDTEGAQQQLERGLSLARRIGYLYGIYNALFNLAQLALALGDSTLARERLRAGTWCLTTNSAPSQIHSPVSQFPAY